MVRPIVSALLLTAALTAHAAAVDDAFVDWSRARMVPLDSEGRAFRALDRDVDAARLIGMGESVHETEPFASYRLQLLQDLVRRHRVTALILEAGLPDVMAADDYVRGRTGTIDYDKAIPGDLGRVLDVRHTIEWLREWNRGKGRSHPVDVFGADLPGREGSMVPALDRLQELAGGDAEVMASIEALRPVATRIASTWWRGAADNYAALSPEEKNALTANVATLVERANRLSSPWARRVALVAQQHETGLRVGAMSPASPREHAMADNIQWLLGRLPARERAVYWAHNAHVQQVAIFGPKLPPHHFASTGSLLSAAMGNAYFAIGTAYGGPSRDGGHEPVADSVDATLAKVAAKPFLLTLTAKRPPEVDSWLEQERPMRFQVDHLIVPLGRAFDAVVFFDHAQPAARADR